MKRRIEQPPVPTLRDEALKNERDLMWASEQEALKKEAEEIAGGMKDEHDRKYAIENAHDLDAALDDLHGDFDLEAELSGTSNKKKK